MRQLRHMCDALLRSLLSRLNSVAHATYSDKRSYTVNVAHARANLNGPCESEPVQSDGRGSAVLFLWRLDF